MLETRESHLEQDQVNFHRASGYDSVRGLAKAEGGDLNFEENVVYDAAAAVPSYLIVYKL